MPACWPVLCFLLLTAAPPDQSSASSPSVNVAFKTLRLRGRVVWLSDALQRQFGIRSVPEARERVLALETAEGRVFPIAEDLRGRGFRRDERLREIPVELLVRQYEGSPVIQVIRLFALREDGKYELDYWCEVCAIAQFERKPCGCCQAMIELRSRKVPDDESENPQED
jgi:hypothetical protein